MAVACGNDDDDSNNDNNTSFADRKLKLQRLVTKYKLKLVSD